MRRLKAAGGSEGAISLLLLRWQRKTTARTRVAGRGGHSKTPGIDQQDTKLDRRRSCAQAHSGAKQVGEAAEVGREVREDLCNLAIG